MTRWTHPDTGESVSLHPLEEGLMTVTFEDGSTITLGAARAVDFVNNLSRYGFRQEDR